MSTLDKHPERLSKRRETPAQNIFVFSTTTNKDKLVSFLDKLMVPSLVKRVQEFRVNIGSSIFDKGNTENPPDTNGNNAQILINIMGLQGVESYNVNLKDLESVKSDIISALNEVFTCEGEVTVRLKNLNGNARDTIRETRKLILSAA